GQKEAIFVVKKDLEKNEIIVGTDKDIKLYSDDLIMNNINFIQAKENIFNGENEIEACCKIRYRQSDQECQIVDNKNGNYSVVFTSQQRAIASGQICAVYLGDDLVMSGIIS
ncbi:tRNA 2-thiouridine(34) synthase MnmA, partial [Candidatus Gracilibacteria bacterium]|nr:tRNA 2-thiouridine(34) synthase MnmA [Candidatus Gracilibacteria bacterium]